MKDVRTMKPGYSYATWTVGKNGAFVLVPAYVAPETDAA